MSGIVLSSSVRQNLLSLQSTADLLATTQSRLSTGKKVNTALDNPTNFFTAQSLDGRASDISNLLDGIGNGVQVLQAANTGITSLSKLVDTAKSIANQALQTTVGYSTKSNVSATVSGATALDLRGTTTFTSATAFSNVLYSGAAGSTTAAGRLDLGGLSGALTGVVKTTTRPCLPPSPLRPCSTTPVAPLRALEPRLLPTATASPSTARPSPSRRVRLLRRLQLRPASASTPAPPALRPMAMATR
jgi:hypothetical protein